MSTCQSPSRGYTHTHPDIINLFDLLSGLTRDRLCRRTKTVGVPASSNSSLEISGSCKRNHSIKNTYQ